MADSSRRRRDGVLGVVGAVTIGAVTASLAGQAAVADAPAFPTWNEVQRAKSDRSAAEAETARITELLGGLQDKLDLAGRSAAIAAETFHRAELAEDAARERYAALATRADAAAAAARTSRMRAGLLAASAARSGGGDARLMLDAGGATDFLHRLATVTQLSAQARTITQRALADENQATALGAEADAAAHSLATTAATAKQRLDAARRSVVTASTAVAAEQQHADRLVAQLADLRGTSTRLAAQYAAEVRAEQAENAASASAQPSASSTARVTRSSAGPITSPDPVAPTPVASTASVGEPNSAQAASAVAFARDQIGDEYRLAGAGPNSWDCSGLTMQAYASIGVGIGGHSATAQYELAEAQGQLVPSAQVRVGDLIFFTDGGGDMYHVAVYSGGGLMIEAPYPGVAVREVPVRSIDRVGLVARPTSVAS